MVWWLVVAMMVCVGSVRSQLPQGYPYVLNNECSQNLKHLIRPSPEEQEEIWENDIAILVSDARMGPRNCQVTKESCEFVEDECEDVELPFNCSIFPGEDDFDSFTPFFGETDKDCVSVTQAYNKPNEVETCIDEDNDELQCCFDPFTKDSDTKECVVACPVYPYGETKYKAVSYLGFSLAWVSFILCLFALFPLFLTRPPFPKDLFPTGILFFGILAQVSFLNVYAGVEETICSSSDDFVIAVEDYFNSTFCHVQAIFFYASAVGLTTLLVCSSIAFAFIASTLSRSVSDSRRREILDKLKIPCFVIIFLATLGGALFQYGMIRIDPLEYLTLAFGFTCGPAIGIESPLFATVLGLFCLNFLFQVVGFYFLFKKSRYLVPALKTLMIFLGIMDFGILMIVLNGTIFAVRDGDSFNDRIMDYAVCVASHPQEEDSGCEFETGDYYAWTVIFVICVTLIPAAAITALYPLKLVWQWWVTAIKTRSVPRLQEASTLRRTSNTLTA